MMKIALIFSLLFAAAVADKNIYMCGVTTTVPDTFDAEPSLLGHSVAVYNAISFGDFFAVSGDVEGATAIKGNLNLPSGQYSFGYERRPKGVGKVDEPLTYSLIVGGNANYLSGAVYAQGNDFPYAGDMEYAYIGGSLTTTDAGLIAQSRTQQGAIDSAFDNVHDWYVKVQDVFANLPADITAVFQYGGMTVTCPDQSASLWVVQMDGADLSKTTYYTKNGCNAKAQFVFNVIGTSDVLFSGDDFNHDINLVLWNVVGSNRIVHLGNASPHGSLLAPNNKYLQPATGVWQGQVIAADFQQVLQINRQFCPPRPTPPQTPSTCVTWETQCAGLNFNFGEANSFVQYNAISFGDCTADTGDIEGRMACRGDVTFGTGYSVGAALVTVNDMPDHHEMYSLIVGGDLVWGNGDLFPMLAGAVIERAYVSGNSTVPAHIVGRVDQAGDLTSTFDAAQSCYCGMSDTLANKAVNTQHTIKYTGMFITCDSATESDYVISITDTEFSQFTYYSLDNCNFGSRWTINVRGTGDVDISGDSFPAAPGGVVYNVIGSGRTVNVHDTQLSGHLLACRSTLNQPSGVIVGKVVAGSIVATKQINSMTTCPLPQTVQLTMVAAQSATKGSYEVVVTAASSFQVGDHTNVGNVVSIDGSTVKLDKPLAQDVSAGSVVGRVYVSSTAGRGKVANPTSSISDSSASVVGVAAIAIAAAALMI